MAESKQTEFSPAEVAAAEKILQMAHMGDARAHERIRQHWDKFQAIMPQIEARTRAAYTAPAISDEELVRGGLPADKLAAARAAAGPSKSAADDALGVYANVMRLLQPEAKYQMEPEVMTASPKAKPAKKPQRRATYTPTSAPEGGSLESQLGASLLNLLQGAGGADFQLQEPVIGGQPVDPLKKYKLPSE